MKGIGVVGILKKKKQRERLVRVLERKRKHRKLRRSSVLGLEDDLGRHGGLGPQSQLFTRHVLRHGDDQADHVRLPPAVGKVAPPCSIPEKPKRHDITGPVRRPSQSRSSDIVFP